MKESLLCLAPELYGSGPKSRYAMKNYRYIYTILFLTIILILTACRKDEDVFIVEDETVSSLKIGVVGGLVTNMDGEILANTSVNLKTKDEAYQTKTDENGVFYFRNLDLKEESTYLYTESVGYFQGSRTFIPKAGNAEFMQISLLPLAASADFEATEGGIIDLPEGAQLNISANAIKDASGADYQGTVNIANNFLEPNQPGLESMMPGNLNALDEDGNWKSLATYGMMALQLTDDAGGLLEIKNPDMAALLIPIAEDQLNSAPSSIAVWSFDTENGYWIPNGSAQKGNGYYSTPITDVDFLNWAIPYPMLNLTTQLQLSPDNVPYGNATVEITVLGSGICAYGTTDNTGLLETTVAANQVLSIAVTGHCGDLIYEGEIGPYANDVQLGTFIVESPNANMIEVNGTLEDCQNTTVPIGYAHIQLGDQSHILFAEVDGSFTSYIDACSHEEFTMSGVDVLAGTEGEILPFQTNEAVNAGTISTCE